jgi:uncharacterized membrane protein YbaN (DUF454 family)
MRNTIKKKLKRALIITLGVFFMLVGLAGLVLPILQGWFFLILGALLLSMYSPRLRAFIYRHTVKYPKVHAFVAKAEGWTERVFGAPEVD